jgi:soluble lytic murein transglycosylase-like protein
MLRLLILGAAFALALSLARGAHAGAQVEEQLSASVINGLAKSIADFPPPANYSAQPAVRAWVDDMSRRIASRISDPVTRRELLETVHYEAARAGLDPQLVLAVIHHESGFRKYAVSTAGARGYMQVMPFWVKQIGSGGQNLFSLRTNLRYGCTILRFYLDRENGDYYRALGRYNGSLGRPEYPTAVMAAMSRYAPSAAVRAAAAQARPAPAPAGAQVPGPLTATAAR